MKNSILYYSVGPLLYCPANRTNLAASVIQQKFGSDYSLALCLEDTINDRFVAQAEEILIHSLKQLYAASQSLSFFMPKIFIRVRRPAQIRDLLSRLEEGKKILSGFILPKFDLLNADEYIRTMQTLKEKLRPAEELVLNIRVGGNDLCNVFGFRRHCSESIHGIMPVANIFSDIITVFGTDYIVSGPVWEYYNQEGWKQGLCRELSDDRLCGFIGKTVIHPKQIPSVNQAYAVSPEDLRDAEAILGWDESNPSFVSASPDKRRMNEYKTHSVWAKKILYLSKAYGVRQTTYPPASE